MRPNRHLPVTTGGRMCCWYFGFGLVLIRISIIMTLLFSIIVFFSESLLSYNRRVAELLFMGAIPHFFSALVLLQILWKEPMCVRGTFFRRIFKLYSTHLYLFLGIEPIIFAIDIEVVFRHVLTYVTQLTNSRRGVVFRRKNCITFVFFSEGKNDRQMRVRRTGRAGTREDEKNSSGKMGKGGPVRYRLTEGTRRAPRGQE